MSTESRGVVRGPASRVESSPAATNSEDRSFSPTFILGAAHSGTTILYRMFALHPEVLWFSQFSLRSGEIAGRWSLPFNDPIDRALRQFTRHDWQKVSSRRLQWIVPTPSEARNVWKDLLDRSGTTDERAAHMRWCVRSFCARRGRRRFVAKWPGFYRDIPVLSAAFPSARFVHIVRDGRPVALSVRHKFSRSGRGREPRSRCAILGEGNRSRASCGEFNQSLGDPIRGFLSRRARRSQQGLGTLDASPVLVPVRANSPTAFVDESVADGSRSPSRTRTDRRGTRRIAKRVRLHRDSARHTPRRPRRLTNDEVLDYPRVDSLELIERTDVGAWTDGWLPETTSGGPAA